ncbi:MAG: AEC family transporter [Oscillospiraceae bacterium]|jgi:predicted permease|nr:AEC family transporter [Oscillospiraceae bacterium]
MDLAMIVTGQVVIMFLLIALGFFLYKGKMIDDHTTSQLTDFLILVITPALIINSYIMPFDKSMAKGLAISLGLAIVSHLVPIFLTKVIFRGNASARARVERFAVIYSNGGFMAIPLVAAVLPENGVFYASAYIVVFNIVEWTQGKAMIQGAGQKLSVKEALINPGTVGTLIGLIIFLFSVPVPSVVQTAIGYVSGLNTPLAMLIIGVYIAKTDIKAALINWRVYFICLLKLIVVPFIIIIIHKFLHTPEQIMMANTLATACPVATACSMFVEKFGGDGVYGASLVAVSTVLSIFTIPVMAMLLRLIPAF